MVFHAKMSQLIIYCVLSFAKATSKDFSSLYMPDLGLNCLQIVGLDMDFNCFNTEKMTKNQNAKHTKFKPSDVNFREKSLKY